MAGRPTKNFEFWQPKRPVRAIDSTTRCRPKRLRTSAILNPPKSSVNFEVETFKIYGRLKKTQTEVHNSLPTNETIQTEKTLLSFDEKRHITPDTANYDDFYRTLAASVTPHASRVGTARSSIISDRSLESRQSTFFTMASNAGSVTSHSSRPSESRQSIFSRLGTSYGLHPLDSRQTDRMNASGYRSLTCRSQPKHITKLTEVGGMNREPKTQRLPVEGEV